MRRGVLAVTMLASVLGLAAFASASTAKLVADHRFDGSFASSVPGAEDAFPLGGGTSFAGESVAGCNRLALNFPADQGVAIHTKDLIGSGPYTMIVQVRFESLPSGYVRVINWFPSLAEDNGLYLQDARLDFYDDNGAESDHLGNTPVPPGQFAELAVTRDSSKLIRGYVNGVPQFSYTDAFDMAVSTHPAGNVYFFVDDAGEESAGAVARIRVYDAALPEGEILNTVGCPDQRCGGAAATIVGDDRDNLLMGTPARDVISGLGGADVIRGLAGRDLLCGGSGRDRLIGGAGRDRLLGGGGRDRLIGAKGRDTCRGGKGRDVRRGCELGRG